jgi:hypothetical protein
MLLALIMRPLECKNTTAPNRCGVGRDRCIKRSTANKHPRPHQ